MIRTEQTAESPVTPDGTRRFGLGRLTVNRPIPEPLRGSVHLIVLGVLIDHPAGRPHAPHLPTATAT